MHCNSQCLKLARKVGFNITSEASYIYNFSGRAKFGEAEACCQTVTRQVNFDRTKIGENAKKQNATFGGDF